MTSPVLRAFALAACFSLAGSAFAGTGNSMSAKQCQKGGWQTLKAGDGSTFESQDACVAYAARGGALYRPLLVAVPDSVLENQNTDLLATGFHPNAAFTFAVEIFPAGSYELTGTTNANGASDISSFFETGACGLGDTGARYTLTDSFGLEATAVVTLVCP